MLKRFIFSNLRSILYYKFDSMFSGLKEITICALFVCVAISAAAVNDANHANSTTETSKNEDLCLTPECIRAAARILSNMNSKVDPCDDFYEFACGNYAKIGSDLMTSTSTKSELEVDSRLLQIIEEMEELSTLPLDFSIVKTSYDNCMKISEWEDDSEARLEAQQNIADATEQWQVNSEIQWNTTSLDPKVVNSYLFKFETSSDETNKTNWVFELSMIDPPLAWSYLNDGITNEGVQAYFAYIQDISNYLGIDQVLENFEIMDILWFDLELAKIVLEKSENYDINHQYTRMTVGELERNYPRLHLKEVLKIGDDDDVVQMRMNADILRRLEEWELEKSDEAFANWIQWRWTVDRIDRLGSYVIHKTNMFLYALNGDEMKQDKWRSCVGQVRNAYPFLLDVLYYGQYLNDSMVEDTTEMFANIRQQFIGFIEKAEWLANGTKQHAIEKIKNIKHNLGAYEVFMLDKKSNTSYRDLQLTNGLLADNRANMTKIIMHLNQTSNDSDNVMSEYNFVLQVATYFQQSLLLNIGGIKYTDAFYNIGNPKALNYGAFGVTLGHELAHSLDDHNRHVDKNGNLNPWWDSQSNETYVKRIQCLVKRYKESGFNEFRFELNSFASRNDDIADHVGVKAAYFAYDKWTKENEPEKKLPGLDYSPRQMFWIAYANSHCSKFQRQYFRNFYTWADHSPEKLRINLPLSNMPEFSNDFKCSSDSKMNPAKKCIVW